MTPRVEPFLDSLMASTSCSKLLLSLSALSRTMSLMLAGKSGGAPLDEDSSCRRKSIFFLEARKWMVDSVKSTMVSVSSYPTSHVCSDVDLE